MPKDIAAMVSPYACDRDIADRVIADRVIAENNNLQKALLRQRIPHPLSMHFKMFDSIGELLEAIPLPYVRQCIEQTALSPLERATMLALVETTEINQ